MIRAKMYSILGLALVLTSAFLLLRQKDEAVMPAIGLFIAGLICTMLAELIQIKGDRK